MRSESKKVDFTSCSLLNAYCIEGVVGSSGELGINNASCPQSATIKSPEIPCRLCIDDEQIDRQLQTEQVSTKNDFSMLPILAQCQSNFYCTSLPHYPNSSSAHDLCDVRYRSSM